MQRAYQKFNQFKNKIDQLAKHTRAKAFLSAPEYYYTFAIVILLIGASLITINLANNYFSIGDESGQYRERFFQFNSGGNRVLLTSMEIIFLLLLALTAIFGRTGIAVAAGLIAGALWSYIDLSKRTSRDAPLIPEDLALIREALAMQSTTDPEATRRTIIFCLMVVTLTFVSYRLLAKFTGYTRLKANRRYPARIILFVVAVIGLGQLHSQIRDPKIANWDKNNWLGSYFISWNQADNYEINGPVLGFFYNIGGTQLSKPDNYNKESIQKIVNKYDQKAKEINRSEERQKIQEIKPDILFVMNESFINPQSLAGVYELTTPVTPYINWLKTQARSHGGTTATTEYGGGTANIEFEALTGLSNWLSEHTTPFNNAVSKIKNFPSLPRHLKQNGYQTAAIHPFWGYMYKRDKTYPNLSIDSLDDVTTLSNLASIPGSSEYASDETAYQAVIDHFNQADSNQPQFMHLVTMQNHMPYVRPTSDTTNYLTPETIQKWNLSENQIENVNAYLYILKHSDQATAKLIEFINGRKRPTVLVFWGDHMPGGDVFNKITDDSLPNSKRYQAELFFYTNFDPTGKIGDLSYLSPNYFSLNLFNLLNLELPPFYALLSELEQKYPAFSPYVEEIDHDEIKQDPLYQEYRLIQYDLLSGKRFSDQMNFFEVAK